MRTPANGSDESTTRTAGEGALDRWFITGGGLLEGDASPRSLTGRELGPFRIVEEIGRGGMSVVYRAERVDGAFEQQVAVKVFDLAPDSPVASRFRDERQLLARLDHPAIARIYDGGELAEGAPYLILELVRGPAIDRHCERLGLDARVSLFLEVCDAVAAAHREAIVHQDLKPDNILIDRHGHPKLLDFGIARAVAAESEEHRLLTPRFAAPEQFAGEPATAATDVFQLGLLLYQLGTDRAATAGDSMAQLRARAGSLPLIRASEAGGPFERRIDRAFDAIIDRCLAEAPENRYADVRALATDVDAWRSGRATSIARGTAAGRVGHWTRRRGLPAAAALLVVLAVAAALAYSWRELSREQARTRAVGDLVTDVLAPPPGDDDRITSSSFEIASGAVADQPELEQELARVSGQRLLAAGDHAAAIELLEPVLTRASGGFENPGPGVAELHDLLAEAYLRARRPDAAERHFSIALRLTAGDPKQIALQLTLHDGRAAAWLAARHPDRAAEDLAAARAIAANPADRQRFEAAVRLVETIAGGACPEDAAADLQSLRAVRALLAGCRDGSLPSPGG